jgi:hypothetical protein
MTEQNNSHRKDSLQETSAFARHISRIGTMTLRKVFAKFAENTALTTLKDICAIARVSYSDTELRIMIKETIVPAYSNGWLDDVVTLSQLHKWVERRTGLSLADPLFDVIGLHQYLLLHCLSSALDAKKLTALDILQKCPSAGYIYTDLYTDADLDAWRKGASIIRVAIKTLEPKDGLVRWLDWVSNEKENLNTLALPLPNLIS